MVLKRFPNVSNIIESTPEQKQGAMSDWMYNIFRTKSSVLRWSNMVKRRIHLKIRFGDVVLMKEI